MKQNISILCPESEFTSEQLQKLQLSGKVTFADSKSLSSTKDLIKISKGADILAFEPERYGKFASRVLFDILDASPKVKGIALNSTTSECIHEDYCQERNIRVITVLDSSATAVAEFIMLLLLGCSRNIFINGWQAKQRNYLEEPGTELFGKALGIIGANATAEELVKRARAFGLTVYLWDEQPIRIEGAQRKSLGEVLVWSDLLAVNLPETESNKHFLNKERINAIKKGAIVVNTSGRNLVDEIVMLKALEEEKIRQYAYEVDKFKPPKMDYIRRVLAFKKLSQKTKEAEARSRTLWVKSIADLAGHFSS